jgi:hypothetical protein
MHDARACGSLRDQRAAVVHLAIYEVVIAKWSNLGEVALIAQSSFDNIIIRCVIIVFKVSVVEDGELRL